MSSAPEMQFSINADNLRILLENIVAPILEESDSV